MRQVLLGTILLFVLSMPLAAAEAQVHSGTQGTDVTVEQQKSVNMVSLGAMFGVGVVQDGTTGAYLIQAADGSFQPANAQFVLLRLIMPFVGPVPEPVDVTSADPNAGSVQVDDQATADASDHGVDAAVGAQAADQTAGTQAAAPVDPPVDVPTVSAPVHGSEMAGQQASAPAYEQGSSDAPAQAAQPAAVGAAPDVVAEGSFANIAEPSLPAVAAATAVVATASAGFAFIAMPGWRFVVIKGARRLLGLLLFSRIAQEDVLNHARRSELVEFVKQNPGERVEVARKTLGISNGSMHYHLKVLGARNLVRVVKDGALSRLYPAGPKINPSPYLPVQRRRIVELLSTRPGISQREVAQLLSMSERMTSYHVHLLTVQGLLEVHVEGARRALFLRGLQTAPTPTSVVVAA